MTHEQLKLIVVSRGSPTPGGWKWWRGPRVASRICRSTAVVCTTLAIDQIEGDARGDTEPLSLDNRPQTLLAIER